MYKGLSVTLNCVNIDVFYTFEVSHQKRFMEINEKNILKFLHLLEVVFSFLKKSR